MISESAQNPLTGLDIDRMTERREDSQWLERAYRDPGARILLTCRGRVLVRYRAPGGPLVAFPAADLQGRVPYSAFLGRCRDRSYFMASVEAEQAGAIAARLDAEFAGLRLLATRLDGDAAALAAYARALDLWHAAHRYCGRCGSATESHAGGFRRRCSNPECATDHFPRLDPAIIVIVGDGRRCLLGRQPNWPERRYSTLAGFVEPGESLEEAVRREVREEAGITLAEVSYHSSQPWPFPSSLMLGFTARAASTRISVGDELEDARWFGVDELAAAVRQRQVLLPFRSSVSYRLIAHWLAREHGIDVAEWNQERPR